MKKLILKGGDFRTELENITPMKQQKKKFHRLLPRPFLVLAPMYEVTDSAFRQIIAARGAPDIFVTEFVSADALVHPEASRKVAHLLAFDERERFRILPDGSREREAFLQAQIFGADPATMAAAAGICAEWGFDGVDINMGCPEKNIQKQGSGAALIRTPERALEILRAVREGAGGLTVSVKTRIGYLREEIDTWLPAILEGKPDILTVHLRTKKEMSLVPAHWEWAERIVAWRDRVSPRTLLVGNGDIVDLEDAEEKIARYGLDGAMLGRAVFGNPWLFARRKKEPSWEEKVRTLSEHTALFARLYTGVRNFAVMKRHFAAYLRGFAGAKKLRGDLMTVSSAPEAIAKLEEFLRKSLVEEEE
ncbi:MAG TPA: tRNA-dihydrouridine synthase [Candidatus Moranbacteria bacterium]|nr:tRNA-dihydrouridine synthase [Candidatus Moranbacteria bacterium]